MTDKQRDNKLRAAARRAADSGFDPQNLAYLEGEARACTFRLGHTLPPVQARIADEEAAFDLLTANAADCVRRQELRSLLSAMSAYCEAVGAYNAQLAQQLAATEEAMQQEASRAAMFLQQLRLVHEDLKTEQALQIQQLETFQSLLRRAA